MSTEVPEVLADPVGVAVGLIAGIDPLLDRAALRAVVGRVAAGRPSAAVSPWR